MGDLDPAGLEIAGHLHKKLLRFSGRSDISFTRLACTEEQVGQFDLLGTEPKKDSYRDPFTGRSVPWRGEAVEVEAIDAPILRTLLSAAITQHIDPRVYRLTLDVEAEERAGISRLAGWWSE